ncbi:uncharacterized protein TRIADDRAFT_52058 [Trichoplax adhaerens]|uniref:Uncharacterized protein n=2 Tax=Trichoplax adhaerens TaxID=10228 RepID=B3RLM8_TRIAD|nr:hypothetical protein TRIADDRAFT_52058 [Trichoplax adhaerens]EDV28810.1 hypothetical protein TRIADDRAFT_52058 [Trichoplax adhaerens]|eukprot:XP_002108012.1 hypothetical protein TRIADDRAFT_52058 [Trichoplax adhaerens]
MLKISKKLNKGQKRRQQLHKREVFNAKVADVITSNEYKPGEPYYVVEITTLLEHPFQLVNGAIVQKLSTYGILTKQQLPKLPRIIIFTPMGKAHVNFIAREKPLFLTEEELDNCEKFHRFLFENVIKTRKDTRFIKNESIKYYLVVPLRENGELHYELITSCINFLRNENYPNRQVCKEVILQFPHQVVVKPSYSLNSQSLNWMLIRKVSDATPMSEFHDTSIAATFYDYYKNQYSIDISDKEQKLVCLRKIPSNNNMLKKFHRILTLTSKSKQSPHFVPELLAIHPLSASRFMTTVCLPSILFRVESLLSVDELRLKIARETGLGLDDSRMDNSFIPLLQDASTYYTKKIGILPHVFHQIKLKDRYTLITLGNGKDNYLHISNEEKRRLVDRKLKRGREKKKQLVINHCKQLRRTISKLTKKTRKWLKIVPISVSKRLFPKFHRRLLHSKLKSNRNKAVLKRPGPSVSMLLQALTSLSADDFFNHERLEILGDSYLKFITTADYFFRNPNMKEGAMSLMRAINVSNSHLSRTSKLKGLTLYQFNTPFKLKQWLPPGFTCIRNNANLVANNMLTDGSKQRDSESFKQVMSVKNISDTVEGLVGVYSLASGPVDAARLLPWIGLDIDPNVLIEKDKSVNFEIPTTDEDIQLSSCILRNTDYQFNNFYWLRIAFTHSSVASENYQRLEYLGDAILEYLLIEFVYCRKPYFGPGKISHFKSVMTRNQTFSLIAIAFQFYTHIRCHSKLKLDIMDSIQNFKEILLDNHQDDHQPDIGHFANLAYQLYTSNRYQKLPKVCADVFEAFIAAIYLDCGKKLRTVWKVVYKMVQRILADILNDVGGLTSTIHDMFPNRIRYQVIKRSNSSKKHRRMFLDHPKLGMLTSEGIGTSNTSAKDDAIRNMLSHLECSDQEIESSNKS